jgi:hypothetical protein
MNKKQKKQKNVLILLNHFLKLLLVSFYHNNFLCNSKNIIFLPYLKLTFMKTIKLFFIAFAVIAVGFFTSCADETVATGPTIDFIAGDGILTSDASVETGVDFTFKWLVTQGTAKLASFTIRLSNTDVTGFPNTDIADNYSDLLTTSQATAGIYAYTFIATDKDGLEDSKTITVTVTNPVVVPTIDTYTDKILGADNNATLGSSFASVDGSVYILADAKTNSSKVDFVYFYGATNLATLAAPSDVDGAQVVFSSITTWTTINATALESTSLTAAEFDLIDSESQITAPAGTATKVNNLAVGNVLAFKTAATSANPSKKGLIKVTALTTEKTGSITITVKVQK